MLPLVHTVVLALHVLFAAAWFGMASALPALVRSAMRPGAAEGGKVVGAIQCQLQVGPFLPRNRYRL